MGVTFFTNCWEGDWEYLLKDGCLERMIRNCNYEFEKKILLINNVKNLSLVRSYVQKKVDQGIIDEFHVVGDYEEDVLSFFETPKESFETLNYFIACATAVFLCKTELLLYFTGDVYIKGNKHNWVADASAKLIESDEYFVINPLWNNQSEEAKSEAYKETKEYYIGKGFSDQCFLVRTNDVRRPIYHEFNTDSNRYPKYGGGAFEKRINSYMCNHDLLRLTSKDVIYIHKSYKKRTLWRSFLYKLGFC